MYCPNCGAIINGQSNFCAKCGTPLHISAVERSHEAQNAPIRPTTADPNNAAPMAVPAVSASNSTSIKNYLGIISLIIGIIAILTVIIVGPLGAIPAIIAGGCSITALQNKGASSRATAIAGLVLSIISLVFGISMFGCTALLIGFDNATQLAFR